MKQVFKCDYCTFMGVEEEVKEHEIKCCFNYDRRSCNTCVHKGSGGVIDGKYSYICKKDKKIPAGKIFEFCESYERDVYDLNSLAAVFGRGLFG